MHKWSSLARNMIEKSTVLERNKSKFVWTRGTRRETFFFFLFSLQSCVFSVRKSIVYIAISITHRILTVFMNEILVFITFFRLEANDFFRTFQALNCRHFILHFFESYWCSIACTLISNHALMFHACTSTSFFARERL